MPNNIEHPTILYIEDNVLSLVLVERLLDARGDTHLISAMSGELGLQLAHVHCPKLVLLDINLPGMNGYRVLEHLRGFEPLKDTPVVAISSDTTAEDLDKAEKAGFSSYLTKPLDVEEFNRLMDRLLGRL